MNILVMGANGAQMPVLYPGGCDNSTMVGDLLHTCMTKTTHLKILADWLVLGNAVASPGDVFLNICAYTLWPALFASMVLMFVELKLDKY